MSADNWRVCPKCSKEANAAKEAQKEAVDASYGKVSRAKYAEMLAESEKPLKLEYTLREDYEIGMTEDGEFYAIYSGKCQTCDFGFKYKHEEKLSLSDE